MFEVENPALKSLPLAIQQKQIIVTCNYEARRRGLHKLQLIREARKVCPDVIIILGEDLTRFRNASKDLYNFLRGFVWSQRVERLGFDEVFLDMSDVINYNVELLNHNDLLHSFFHLDQTDPTVGFAYNASVLHGHAFPPVHSDASGASPGFVEPVPPVESAGLLRLRLILGSHLAGYLRRQLEEHKGYTATVGISTNKLLSKLVGNMNKPNSQTTLVPPYEFVLGAPASNVITFMDLHDVGKVPGIGFKMSQKIRGHVLQRSAKHDTGLVYGGTKENVHVKDVRLHPGMGAKVLDELLGGPGAPEGTGNKVWLLLNGIDDTEVGMARAVPRQISIEDSYIRLDTMDDVVKELGALSKSLLRRMRLDLTEVDNDPNDLDDHGEELAGKEASSFPRRWLAHPRTLRLSTRPRPPMMPDGTRSRSFNRISRSAPMPSFVFSLKETIEVLAEKLVGDALVPSFRKLHPEPSGWNLSLVNIAAVNMMPIGSDHKDAGGRDISRMFRRQDEVLKPWKVEDFDETITEKSHGMQTKDSKESIAQSDGKPLTKQKFEKENNAKESTIEVRVDSDSEEAWDSGGETDQGSKCRICGLVLPEFAMSAHERFHMNPD